MPAISVLIKPASGQCNMSCEYCFYCDEMNKRKQQTYGFMTEQTLKNMIRRTLLKAEGMVSYAFQGGEPTLIGLDFYKKVVAFQKQYNKNNIRICNAFQTNGMLIQEEWCRFFRDHHFLVGLSVDGTARIHNSLRHTKNGADSFEQVCRAARCMDDFWVEYNILTVVTREVALHVRQIYEEYRMRGWNYQQYIACLDPLGETHGERAYAISPELYGRFLIELFELWYQDWKAGTPTYIRQFENYAGLAAGYMAESCDQRGVCGIQYVVEADGSVYPCDFYVLDEYRLGNFNTDRLEQIDQRRRETGFLERSTKLDPQCLECPYYRLCRGGCQRSRDARMGGEFYSSRFCEGYRLFFAQCYDRIVEVSSSVGTIRHSIE